MVNSTISAVTETIIQRSRASRQNYLAMLDATEQQIPPRKPLSCGNLAHGFAAADKADKDHIRDGKQPNIAIVSAYNDMLSAHQPLGSYPEQIKAAARQHGATAQVAGGVPAMCDGVTQGQPGMEMSLFSRDVIAQSTAVALSHNLFNATLCLGVCDKIVPGLLIGALQFGHLPTLFIPAGRMPTGISNEEKSRVRKAYAEGKASKEQLMDAEASAYHCAGTCTFYGTANTNQLLLEAMGLMLPGCAFVQPKDPLRGALTLASTQQAIQLTQAANRKDYQLGHLVDERCLVNAIVALLASGGSTMLTIHLIAIAAAAGIIINWDDFAALSSVTPLLCRVYPNGQADVNAFHQAGGTNLMIGELIRAGLLHGDVNTVWQQPLQAYAQAPYLDAQQQIRWRAGDNRSQNPDVLQGVDQAFSSEGGLQLLTGNVGRAIIKTSAVAPEHRIIDAPAAVFTDQTAVREAFEQGLLNRDVVVVVKQQGPRANGMPELHQLTPALSVLQDRGFSVALVTDGRMSGASGKVPAAIHLVPEAVEGGTIDQIQNGDRILLDASQGTLQWFTNNKTETALISSTATAPAHRYSQRTLGRQLFSAMRQQVTDAERGATIFYDLIDTRNQEPSP